MLNTFSGRAKQAFLVSGIFGALLVVLLWWHSTALQPYVVTPSSLVLGNQNEISSPSSSRPSPASHASYPPPPPTDEDAASSDLNSDVEIVIASMRHENTSWVGHFLSHWRRSIYVVDDPEAPLTVPKNKGREAMVILTYLIDHYNKLPSSIIFHHATRFQWHVDDPSYDALPPLQHFNLSHLQSQGYVNMRCAWVLGCPAEIHPLADEASYLNPSPDPNNPSPEPTTAQIFASAFRQLFPILDVPSEVGVPCCSQFGVSRSAVLSRPLSDYVRYRQWLLDTPLHDALSGRVFEYSWHMIFGKEAVHCPDAGMCYCDVYGLCDLEGCTENTCEGRYELPRFATLPKGWPFTGWEGEDRGWVGEVEG